MPTWTFNGPWWVYALWNLGAFTVAFFLNSFIEWVAHRYVMHRLFPLLPYGYEHTTSHHARFGSDLSYVVIPGEPDEDERKTHILFTWKEYTLFPLLCIAVYGPVEYLSGKPILAGVLAATFVGLQMFNSLHWRYHVPSDSWFQETRFFKFLREHHRLHHENMSRNFNVHFLPIADFCLGTLRRTDAGPVR